MSFAKPEIMRETPDETHRLMCSVNGCNNRWSVNMGSPKCSFHQWGPKTQNSTTKVVSNWYEKENHE